MKRLIILFIAILSITSVVAQDSQSEGPPRQYFVTGGIGTSWIILPKVFIVNPNVPSDNAQILPALNGFTGYVGFQTLLPLGETWLFAPEIDFTYTSGQIRLDRAVNGDTTAIENFQNYVRAEIPLIFGVRSNDNFWVGFGPAIYFTLYDNKGFEKAVESLPYDSDTQVDSNVPVGIRFRLSAYARLGNRSYLNLKFESDLGQRFRYVDDTYDVKFSLQNISLGFGYMLSSSSKR